MDYIALPKEAAVQNLLERCSFCPGTETVSLADGLHRTAAECVCSRNDLPNMLASRMDGIAVHFRDFQEGRPDTSTWSEGKEFVFCNTGIGIRGDYDTVIRIEDVVFEKNGALKLLCVPQEKGELTIPVGAQMREGELLVKQGDLLTPLLLSRLASGGYNQIEVLRKPVVAFIPTGNELVPAGMPVPAGKNVDSNSIMAYAKIVEWGGSPLLYPIQPDNLSNLIHTLQDALHKADVVIINAGSSKGTEDYTIRALEAVGTILSHMITSGPGVHTSCTVAPDGKPIVGIPGPAVGAECTMDWFVKPLLDRYLGQSTTAVKVRAIYQGSDYAATGKRFSLIRRAFLTRQPDGVLFAVPAEPNDHYVMDKCNGFIMFPPTGLRRGEEIEAELRYPYRFL